MLGFKIFKKTDVRGSVFELERYLTKRIKSTRKQIRSRYSKPFVSKMLTYV